MTTERKRKKREAKGEGSWKYLLFLLPLAFALAVACASDPTPTPTPIPTPTFTPTPDPAAVLRQSGEAMQALKSVRFKIVRTGGPTFIDPDGLFVLEEAEGFYSAPDSAQAIIRLKGPGLNLDVNTIAIGDVQWYTNFLTRQWEELPPGWGFNPAIIFNAEQGWRPMLEEDLVETSPMRRETLDGKEYIVITATVAGQRIRTITAGAAQSDEPVPMTFWIEPETLRVVQTTFNTPSPIPDAEDSMWTLTFSEFNKPVTIEPPLIQ